MVHRGKNIVYGSKKSPIYPCNVRVVHAPCPHCAQTPSLEGGFREGRGWGGVAPGGSVAGGGGGGPRLGDLGCWGGRGVIGSPYPPLPLGLGLGVGVGLGVG